MGKKLKTHIICFDDYRGFSEEVRKRFADTDKYSVLSFPTREGIVSSLEDVKEHHYCKVAILSLHDNREQFDLINQLVTDIKKLDLRTGIILLGPADKIEDIKKSIKFNIDAYIPRNSNSILRIHNTVKKLISEYTIVVHRKRRIISLYILLCFILLSIILSVLAYYRLPQYF